MSRRLVTFEDIYCPECATKFFLADGRGKRAYTHPLNLNGPRCSRVGSTTRDMSIRMEAKEGGTPFLQIPATLCGECDKMYDFEFMPDQLRVKFFHKAYRRIKDYIIRYGGGAGAMNGGEYKRGAAIDLVDPRTLAPECSSELIRPKAMYIIFV